LVKLDVIGKLVTLSEREAEELRAVAAAEAGRSSARCDLSLLLDRGLRTRTTVALSRAEARELAELLTSGGFRADLAVLQEALREALEDAQGSAASVAPASPLLLRGARAPQSEVAVPGIWLIYREVNSSSQCSAMAVAAARFGSMT
jgi:hypothetical protein